MQPIKFRGFDPIENKMLRWDEEICEMDEANPGFLWRFLNGETRIIPMRFTGLLDTNGTEIWEGDLVQMKLSGNVYEVVYERGAWWAGVMLYYDREEVLVIGNRFEHPHLIPKE